MAEDTVVYDDLPLHGTEAPPAFGLAGDQPSNRLATTSDDDFLAGFRLRKQAGEMGFGPMDVDCRHGNNLADGLVKRPRHPR